MTLGKTERLHAAGTAPAVLLRIILGEQDRETVARCVLHCALHYSLSARPSLRAKCGSFGMRFQTPL
jgi:hypothetical protein